MLPVAASAARKVGPARPNRTKAVETIRPRRTDGRTTERAVGWFIGRVVLGAHARTGISGVATVEEAEQGLSRLGHRPRKNARATPGLTGVQRTKRAPAGIFVKKYIICANVISAGFDALRLASGADHPLFSAADRLRRPIGAARPLWR
jgi:hypothetical protein